MSGPTRRGRLRSFLTVSSGDVRSCPGRAILSGVSLFVGVLAVISIYTASAIVQDLFVAQEEQRAGRAATAQIVAEAQGGDIRRSVAALHEELAARADPQGAASAVSLEVSALLRTVPEQRDNAPAAAVESTWVLGDLARIRRLPLLDGAWGDSSHGLPPSVVANTAAIRLLGASVGDERFLQISTTDGWFRARIDGHVADGDISPRVYGGLPSLMETSPTSLSRQPFVVSAHSATEDTEGLKTLLTSAMTSAGWSAGGEAQRVDQVPDIRAQLAVVQIAFVLCAAVALLISAVGILNIGLASIAERSHELVIRRALGATRLHLFGAVVLSSLVVALAASALSVLIAVVAVALVVPGHIPLESAIEAPQVPWAAVVAAVTAAVSTCLLGSALPAAVAARLSIANALRE